MFAVVFSGLFFDKHLKYIKLSEDFVSFTKMNLTYLQKVILKSLFKSLFVQYYLNLCGSYFLEYLR